MTDPRTAMQELASLGFPLPDPDPVPGCGQCVQLVMRRAAARLAGDLARVSDCNVHLRRHPHEAPRLSLPDAPRRR